MTPWRLARSILLSALAVTVALPSARAASLDDAYLIDAFSKTVFGVEYDDPGVAHLAVRKYDQPVKVFIDDRAAIPRKTAVARFVASLPALIDGLQITEVARRGDANFRVYVVDRKDYGPVVRGEIYRSQEAAAPGRCFVRVLSTDGAIYSTDAVLVSDEGEFLFSRCMIEEVLQGLGPINDNSALKDSVFNDTSPHDDFTLTDRFILNMLYDRRIETGMTKADTDTLLPFLLPDIRQRIGAKGGR